MGIPRPALSMQTEVLVCLCSSAPISVLAEGHVRGLLLCHQELKVRALANTSNLPEVPRCGLIAAASEG